MQDYQKLKSEGECLVAKSVDDNNRVNFVDNMNRALILYNQAVESLPAKINDKKAVG